MTKTKELERELFHRFYEITKLGLHSCITPIRSIRGKAESLYPALQSVFSLPPLELVEEALSAKSFGPLQEWFKDYEEGERLCSPTFWVNFYPDALFFDKTDVVVTIETATSGRRISLWVTEGMSSEKYVSCYVNFSSEQNPEGSQYAAYQVVNRLDDDDDPCLIRGSGRSGDQLRWMQDEVKHLERLLQMEEMKDIVQGVLLDGALQEVKETGTLSPETKEALAPMLD